MSLSGKNFSDFHLKPQTTIVTAAMLSIVESAESFYTRSGSPIETSFTATRTLPSDPRRGRDLTFALATEPMFIAVTNTIVVGVGITIV